METDKLQLIEPSLAYQDQFLNMLKDYFTAGEQYYLEGYSEQEIPAFINRLTEIAGGIDLADDIVPMKIFWLINDKREILGESRLRLRLNPKLEREGGHIGYKVRPTARRQGYGTKILALTLAKAVELALTRIRITCDADNIGSVRIIEKNRGILSGSAISDYSGRLINQYWIEI